MWKQGSVVIKSGYGGVSVGTLNGKIYCFMWSTRVVHGT